MNDTKAVLVEQLEKKKKKIMLCTAKLFEMFKLQLFPKIVELCI